MSADSKWGFIINPTAGGRFSSKYEQIVPQKIKQFNINGEARITEQKGHATEIAKEMADNGFTHIIAVGGDGTFNETAKAIIDREGITFGCVSGGTGNDFIQVLGFSNHFTDNDWDILFDENTILMDVGKCNENYFLNGMGLGFDAKVATENFANDDGSTGNYLWHILKHLFTYKENEMTFEIDGSTFTQKSFMNTIGIGRRFAGGYYLTAKAIANDGLLDVCTVNGLNVINRFILFLKVPKGKHVGSSKVAYCQTGSIKIRIDEKAPYHLDGELFADREFHVQIFPEKLKIIYNPNGDHYFK
jgi:diacylglycerol kinase (ATP)